MNNFEVGDNVGLYRKGQRLGQGKIIRREADGSVVVTKIAGEPVRWFTDPVHFDADGIEQGNYHYPYTIVKE